MYSFLKKVTIIKNLYRKKYILEVMTIIENLY